MNGHLLSDRLVQGVLGLGLDLALVAPPPLVGLVGDVNTSRVSEDSVEEFRDATWVSLDSDAGQVEGDLGAAGCDGDLAVGGHVDVEGGGEHAGSPADCDFRCGMHRSTDIKQDPLALAGLDIEVALDVRPANGGTDCDLLFRGERHRQIVHAVAGDAVDPDVGCLQVAFAMVGQTERVSFLSDLGSRLDEQLFDAAAETGRVAEVTVDRALSGAAGQQGG